ncbi:MULTISPECIES: hypothetical protein [Paraburkholderia]|uniref:hypothetical protein n=1 Tax=Paraburkholderia TaxID=1822464 RepID=UPI0013A6946D|nr:MULTISPECIES: hypothetical protein [Paraburkholderia]MDH6149541.1 hypothetical protein [Paraburkholderia sp. WSM4179]
MSSYDHVIGAKVSPRERTFLVEALELLMRERSNALRIATAVAKARGERVPEVRDFGLDDILRLSRQIAEVPSVESTENQSEAPPSSKQTARVGGRKPS